MYLTERQADALSEMVNIAFGRAGAALSLIANRRVLLDAPQVAICAIDELPEALGVSIGENVATVHQIFEGPVAGDAVLVMEQRGATQLIEALAGDYMPSGGIGESAREVLNEIGNIILGACLGMFGDLLQVRIKFAVPRVYMTDLSEVFGSMLISGDELRYGLVISMRFHLQDSAMSGYLAIVMGVTSLVRLLEAIESWEKRQMGEQPEAE